MSTIFFILELLTCISILYNYFRVKPSASKRKLSFFVLFSILAFGYYAGLEASPIMTLPPTLIILILCPMLFDSTIFSLVTKILLITLFTTIIPNTFLYAYYIVTAAEFDSNSTISRICYCLCYLAFIIIPMLTKDTVSPHFEIFNELHGRQNLLIFCITIFDFMIFTVSALLIDPAPSINRGGRILLVLCIIAVVLLSILILIQYFHLKKFNLVLCQNNQMNEQLLQQEEQHYLDIQKKNEDLRAFRHDYNHHISALHALAKEENISALQEYIFTLSNIKENLSFIQTNNVVADTIINYFLEAYSERITFNIEGKFPASLFITNHDLCTLLSNTLKNAVEAATQTDSPSISLSLFANDEYATLFVQNSSREYTQKELVHLTTTKNDTTNHGFGLRNIEKVVQEYNGTLDLDYDDGTFFTRIYLHNINQDDTI